MKLTIKSNGKLISALSKTFERSGENYNTKLTYIEGEIYAIEIDFEPCALFSDFEFWLEDENGEFCDHIGMNVSKRKKLLTHK